eukprot:GHVU01038226.1.p1 GENE.GHVU01038226.1~~GHVU01038226.1.p1  ORF type:complete len:494 (-),score=116.24 GHVU01038226.1:451-1932(-)
MRIGPEPTTDRFVAVQYGDRERVVPGNAAAVDKTGPFSQLSNFGNTFLSKFEVSVVDCPVLKGVTLIDTPGVLSGNKQMSRGYDFEGVIKWFATRVDLIFLMFDAHKLDISDEFYRCIGMLKGNETKIRIILNKADSVSTQQLLRVYGALMWVLGRVFNTCEVSRVYIGSFWDQPLHYDENRALFEAEASDLYGDMCRLPKNAALRKLSDLIKRARLCKAHMFLMSHMRTKFGFFGRDATRKTLLDNLPEVYKAVCQEYGISAGDLPPAEELRLQLQDVDIHKFPKMDKSCKAVRGIDEMLCTHIPRLIELLPKEERESMPLDGHLAAANPSPFMDLREPHSVQSAAAAAASSSQPTQAGTGGAAAPTWGVSRYLMQRPNVDAYRHDFNRLGPDVNGFLSADQTKEDLEKSKMPSAVLHRIWNLADVTRDGFLDLYEYSLARHFIQMKVEGLDLPNELPKALLPARRDFQFGGSDRDVGEGGDGYPPLELLGV